jgi:hypothetical protein
MIAAKAIKNNQKYFLDALWLMHKLSKNCKIACQMAQ